MCWKINRKEFEENPDKYHKIAKKDISVYKIGGENDGMFIPRYHSITFSYEPNKANKLINLKIEDNHEYFDEFRTINVNVINEGYHSYSGKCNLKKAGFHDFEKKQCNFFELYGKSNIGISDKPTTCYCSYEQGKLGKFIIPKGAEYYENDKGEIVSSQLIWANEVIEMELLESRMGNNGISFKDIIF